MSKVYRSFLWTGSGDYHDFFGTAGIPCVSDRIPVKINEGLQKNGGYRPVKNCRKMEKLAENRDELTKVIGNKYRFCGKLHKILYQFGEICYNVHIDEGPL